MIVKTRNRQQIAIRCLSGFHGNALVAAAFEP
jgi:hypothetical protein